jgi:hypothetical protein
MTGNKQYDTLTIREIEYSIRITDKNSDSHDLDNLLRTELTRFEDTRRQGDNPENPIQKFLRTNIERSVVIRDNTKVYFLNYQEKGSLSIRFKLLVISRYLNYGTIRQALDYLIKDTIADYFEELLERHLPVSITVSSDDNELYEMPVKQPPMKQAGKRETFINYPLIVAAAALFFSIITCVWILARQNPRQDEAKPADDFRDKYYELIIRDQTREILELEKEKSEYRNRKYQETDADTALAEQQ